VSLLNGSALRHYHAMKAEGKEYPLVVKLGTITPQGADVYSYATDEAGGSLRTTTTTRPMLCSNEASPRGVCLQSARLYEHPP